MAIKSMLAGIGGNTALAALLSRGTLVYDLPNYKQTGDPWGSGEINLLSNVLELFAVHIADLIGAGCWSADDFTLSIHDATSVAVSGGTALVGGAGGRKLVVKTEEEILDDLVLSTTGDLLTNYICLTREGEFAIATAEAEVPLDSLVIGEAYTNTTGVQSVNTSPTLRANIGEILCSLHRLKSITGSFEIQVALGAEAEHLVDHVGSVTFDMPLHLSVSTSIPGFRVSEVKVKTTGEPTGASQFVLLIENTASPSADTVTVNWTRWGWVSD